MSTPRFAFSSESTDWFTPLPVIEAVRSTLGYIDLDPASCEEANQVVKARRFFNIEDDGLSRDWHADTVFCNPPYGWCTRDGKPWTKETGGTRVSSQDLWLRKAEQEFKRNSMFSGLILVNACVGDDWFWPYLKDYPVVFFKRRIRFYQPGKKANSPTKGNAMILMTNQYGLDRAFEYAFRELGVAMQALDEYN